MELAELVRQRRSIRGYRREPVPKALIRELIEIATEAPSSMNTQPWHFHVVTGEPLERIREENTELMMAGAPLQREIRLHGKYEGEHRERQVEGRLRASNCQDRASSRPGASPCRRGSRP